MLQSYVFTEEEKQRLAKQADATFKIPFHFKNRYWLAAEWDDLKKDWRARVVTETAFENNIRLFLVTRHYKPVTYIPDNWDWEDESEIVTGSIDPKTGRRRIVIDPYKPKIQAAPIKDQVDWSEVPRFVLPPLDKIPGWSKAQDEQLDKDLIELGMFRPESKSMTVRVEGMDQVLRYNSKLVPHALVSKKARELHLRFPESNFEMKLSRRTDFQCDFDRSQSGSIVLEWMRGATPDAKNSILRTLYETGQFDEFPFMVRATALLMSRGFSTKDAASEIFLDQVVGLSERGRPVDRRRRLSDDDFERFRWIYSEDDFQRFRSVVDHIVSSLSYFAATRRDPCSTGPEVKFGDLLKRFRLTWNRLSEKQREAARALRMGIRKSTFKAVAAQLGIGVDALKERWTLVKRRFRKAFPEFKGFYPSRTYTNSQKGALIYWGLYRHRSAAHIHEVKWTHYDDDGAEVKMVTPELYRGPKREKSEAFLKWMRDHKFLEEAVTMLDEPGDLEALEIEKRADLEETEKTPELYKIFRANLKRARDLSIASPDEDDTSEPPMSPP